jgi:hypothetical protein
MTHEQDRVDLARHEREQDAHESFDLLIAGIPAVDGREECDPVVAEGGVGLVVSPGISGW